MSNPKVSIVTTSYNHEKYIREALESFVTQHTKYNFEIIISDDASDDKTPVIIKEYAKAYPNIFRPILRDKNIGSQDNFIHALKQAKGEYIALCDGDDFWTDTEKLQKQIDFLDNNPSYALCFHPIRVIYENIHEEELIWPTIKEKSKINLKELLKENFIPSNAVVYRRQSYEKIPNNVMPLDWYLHMYHAQFGKIGFIDRTMATYRRHEAGIWWNSYSGLDNLWQRYGLSHVAMYIEALKLYGKDKDLKEVIHKSLSAAIRNLTTVDDKYQEGLLKKALNEFSDFGIAEVAITSYHHQLEEEDEMLRQKDKEIEGLQTEMLDLRSQVFHLRDEVNSLRNARVLGKIISLRELIGASRQQVTSLPRRAVHKTRVVVAPFIPGPGRRFIKRIYKKMWRASQSYQASLMTINTKVNKPWDKLPLVSVIIPYYNRADTIDDTLDSLKAQVFRNFEVIIVDDGSTEAESISKLDNIKKNNPEVKVIHQPNQGVAAARNHGINSAKGKYIICLDSDDMLGINFIEKCAVVLESNPDVSIVTSYMDIFGVVNEPYEHIAYDPLDLNKNNMVITAAAFRKEAWLAAGGYKSGIGYEDWEFWMNLSELGFWGKLIPEILFKYRTSMQSRYVEDKDIHWNNLKAIRSLHPNYKQRVTKLLANKQNEKNIIEPKTALINMNNNEDYHLINVSKGNILITIPWMTFGGAETLIYNYCREVKDQFNLSFITGLKSEHEWEYKFKEITPNIYHLANLFEDKALYLEFISNYIKTRNIDVLHIIHNGFTFEMLPEIRKRHPDIKIAVTLFNDRVEYFEQSINFEKYIDRFITDNVAVANHYKKRLKAGTEITVIPNGINSSYSFNPKIFDREHERKILDIGSEDTSVFFIGRLAEEKNPDIFLSVAKRILTKSKNTKIKFFIIGDGPKRAEVEKSIKTINSKNIHYLGYQAEIARYLSAADIFVLPSSIEGFPLSILEAMAMKVAVVASNVGAVSDVISSGEDGFIVSPGSVEEIEDIIERISADPELLEKVKSNSRKKVEKKYSNTILGANYKKLYREILA